MYCCICKSGQHLARRCPHLWKRESNNEREVICEEAREDARVTARMDACAGEHVDMAVYSPLSFTPDEEWPPDPDSEPAESSCVPESS